MPRPRVTFSRNGTTSSGASGPPNETRTTASYGDKSRGVAPCFGGEITPPIMTSATKPPRAGAVPSTGRFPVEDLIDVWQRSAVDRGCSTHLAHLSSSAHPLVLPQAPCTPCTGSWQHQGCAVVAEGHG